MPRFRRDARFFDSASGSDNDSDSSSDVRKKSKERMSAQVKLDTADQAQAKRMPSTPVQGEQDRRQSARSPSPSASSRQAASVSATTEPSSPIQELSSGLTIQDLWDNAEANFKSLTGVPLRAKSDDGLKHVLSRLDTKYGTGATEKGAKTKKIVGNIIEVIKNLGGIAVQGASMVSSFPNVMVDPACLH